MIGLRNKGASNTPSPDKVEQKVFELRNAVEGKVVYFFEHAGGSYDKKRYKAIIITNNSLRDISTMFEDISDMIELDYKNSIVAPSGNMNKALRNLSLIAYGKENGFRYEFIAY